MNAKDAVNILRDALAPFTNAILLHSGDSDAARKALADTAAVDFGAVPLPVQAQPDEDLLEVVRTFCSIAARMRDLPDDKRALYPSPTCEGSPLLMAARAACLKRGYTEDGLSTDTTPVQVQAQPVAGDEPTVAPMFATILQAACRARALIGAGDHLSADTYLQIAIDALAATQPAAASIDEDKLLNLMLCWENSPRGPKAQAAFDKIIAFIKAWADSRAAAASLAASAAPIAAVPEDANRLDFVIDEGCMVEHATDISGRTIYWLNWPNLHDIQTGVFASGREAIDDARPAAPTTKEG